MTMVNPDILWVLPSWSKIINKLSLYPSIQSVNMYYIRNKHLISFKVIPLTTSNE